MPDLTILVSPEEIDQFNLNPPQTHTPLWKYWQAFVEDREFAGYSKHTTRSVYEALRMIMKRTDLCTLEQINEIKHFRTILKDQSIKHNWSHQTYNDYVRKTRSYFDWLASEDYLDQSNLSKLRKRRPQPKEQETLSRHQVLTVSDWLTKRKPLYKSLQYYRDVLIFQILEFTGLRNCELLDMKTDAIYLDEDDNQWKVRIQGKKQKGRAKFFNAPMYMVSNYCEYMALRRKQNIKNDFLWVSVRNPDKAFSPHTLKMLYKRVSDGVGFKVSGHRYRRFVATELARRGVDIHDIRRHLGHTRLSTTELYIERSGCLTASSTAAMLDVLIN